MVFAWCNMMIFTSCVSAQTNDPDFAQREHLLKIYVESKGAFAKNDLQDFKANLVDFQTEIKRLRLKALQFEDMARLKKVRDSIGFGLAELQAVASINDAKRTMSVVSTQMWSMIEKMKFSENPLYLQYCPMEDAYWISEDKHIFNPFSPREMPNCGSVVKGLTEQDYKVEACH